MVATLWNLKLSLYDYIFSRRSLVTYICHPGITVIFLRCPDTELIWVQSIRRTVEKRSRFFLTAFTTRSFIGHWQRQIEFQYMSMFLMPPIFLKLFEAQKPFKVEVRSSKSTWKASETMDEKAQLHESRRNLRGEIASHCHGCKKHHILIHI